MTDKIEKTISDLYNGNRLEIMLQLIDDAEHAQMTAIDLFSGFEHVAYSSTTDDEIKAFIENIENDENTIKPEHLRLMEMAMVHYWLDGKLERYRREHLTTPKYTLEADKRRQYRIIYRYGKETEYCLRELDGSWDLHIDYKDGDDVVEHCNFADILNEPQAISDLIDRIIQVDPSEVKNEVHGGRLVRISYV